MLAWGQVKVPPPSDSCRVQEVIELPGSHEFASHFLEAMAGDPSPHPRDRSAIWGLTADLSSRVPAEDRALYISKSTDGGKTWIQVARVGPGYFDADIGEGERNGLAVSPGGTEFVVTTQKGAFQILPQPGRSEAIVKAIHGPEGAGDGSHGDHPESQRRSGHRGGGQDNAQWQSDGDQLWLL